MPTIITRGAASAQGFGFSKVSLGGPYWIESLTIPTGSGGISSSLLVDADGNIYWIGSVNTSGANYNSQLTKIDKFGAIVWQKTLTGAVTNTAPTNRQMKFDSSGNILCNVGFFNGSITTSYLIKYDTSGNVVFQKVVSISSNNYLNDLDFNSSGNVIAVGQTYDNTLGVQKLTSIEFDTTGAITKSIYTYSNTGDHNVIANAIAINKTLNKTYVVGQGRTSGVNFNYPLILSLDASLYANAYYTFQSANGDYFSSISIDDASSNFACCTSTGYLIKLDSSMNILWQRKLSASNGFNLIKVFVNQGDIYVVGSIIEVSGGSTKGYVAKYNSSGVLQFQRSFQANGAPYTFITSVKIYGNDMIINGYFIGASYGENAVITVRLPKNGTKTGTYSSSPYTFIYAASTATDASSSVTTGYVFENAAAPSLTSSSSSLTVGTSTYSSSIINI